MYKHSDSSSDDENSSSFDSEKQSHDKNNISQNEEIFSEDENFSSDSSEKLSEDDSTDLEINEIEWPKDFILKTSDDKWYRQDNWFQKQLQRIADFGKNKKADPKQIESISETVLNFLENFYRDQEMTVPIDVVFSALFQTIDHLEHLKKTKATDVNLLKISITAAITAALIYDDKETLNKIVTYISCPEYEKLLKEMASKETPYQKNLREKTGLNESTFLKNLQLYRAKGGKEWLERSCTKSQMSPIVHFEEIQQEIDSLQSDIAYLQEKISEARKLLINLEKQTLEQVENKEIFNFIKNWENDIEYANQKISGNKCKQEKCIKGTGDSFKNYYKMLILELYDEASKKASENAIFIGTKKLQIEHLKKIDFKVRVSIEAIEGFCQNQLPASLTKIVREEAPIPKYYREKNSSAFFSESKKNSELLISTPELNKLYIHS